MPVMYVCMYVCMCHAPTQNTLVCVEHTARNRLVCSLLLCTYDVYVYIRMHVCTCIHVPVYATCKTGSIEMCVHVFYIYNTHTYIHTYAVFYPHLHIDLNISTIMLHTFEHTYIHIHVPLLPVHSLKHFHCNVIYAHTYIHTYIHACIHTYAMSFID